MAFRLLVAILAIATLLGCSRPGSPPADTKCSAQAPPADQRTDATEQPLRLVPSHAEVKPGQPLTITIEGDLPAGAQIVRGLDSYLECWTGTGWSTQFVLLTGNPPTSQPFPMPQGTGFDAVGLLGRDPEPVQMPTQAAPGIYRIRKEVYLEQGAQRKTMTLYVFIIVDE